MVNWAPKIVDYFNEIDNFNYDEFIEKQGAALKKIIYTHPIYEKVSFSPESITLT